MTRYRLTGERRWIEEAQRVFDWFRGKNDLQAPLYDANTRMCLPPWAIPGNHPPVQN
jgi:hypothetical protein